ncbi:Ig-like domain-containing protein [Lutispora sp.]|uniref:Ig-like domain-containing protein n=1 Tax=Lutispora sp. TaxID=2828727 RepID=UPI00356252FA
MKKTLALVLALALVFSSITVAFAEETIGAEAQLCADLGMLKGETGTVDAAYVATAPKRIQAAIMFLRLKGLEAEALAFTGEDNFADGNIAWAEGANLLAYLKANPQLGWQGDGVNFNPDAAITAQQYYKVLLEALGYKQTVEGVVVGDFTWDEVLTFAAEKGLAQVAAVENFTVNDLAVATVEALKANMKDVETTLAATLVEAGKIDEAKAAAAGLVEDKNAVVEVAVKKAKALGSTIVQVEFEDDVDAAAAGNVDNYSIEGLTINSAVVTDTDLVRLETETMTSGKLYKLTVGEKTVQYTGIAKVSGSPSIKDIESRDVEEIVITFDKNIDFASGSEIANYSVTGGVEVVAAEVDGDEVTLTTEGLKNKTKYTVKATNIKSIEGVAKKSTSDTVTVNYDLVAPKISDIQEQTNQRIVVFFTEEVDKESAENLENYSIKVNKADGDELEIVSVTWDDDDEDNVEIVTEPMEKRLEYKLSINNIADQRKVANVMTRPATKTFKGVAEDKNNPKWKSITVLSPTTIMVEFSDESRIDEESALDLNNYTLDGLDIESIETLKNEWKVFRALLTVEEMETSKNYKLTIADVLDEFGNALKEDHKTAKGIAESFKSAKLLSAIATDEDEIVLTFDKEVDETTAENLANYSVNKEVGNPTKATLEDDGVTVTLEVNDLVNGRSYKVTADGVEDLAGNQLYYKVSVDTTTNNWDDDAPELEDATILNEYVVALSFDEMVNPHPSAKVALALDVDEDGNYDPADNVYLPYADLVDDDTVVEFSGVAPLVNGERYTVVGIVYGAGNADGGIRDLYGNALFAADIEVGEFEFDGIDDEYEDFAEVESYEQVDAKTFNVTMSRDVLLWDGSDIVASISVGGFTVTVDADDDFVLNFTKNSGIIDDEDDDYEFDLRDFVIDLHGMPAANADTEEETFFSPEYKDEDAPYVDEVEAVDRKTIRVTFSENINALNASKFSLQNYDTDKTVSISGVAFDPDNDNAVLITVTKPLEARYEYELTVKVDAVKDYVPLGVEDEETWYFQGTNLAE